MGAEIAINVAFLIALMNCSSSHQDRDAVILLPESTDAYAAQPSEDRTAFADSRSLGSRFGDDGKFCPVSVEFISGNICQVLPNLQAARSEFRGYALLVVIL